MSGPKYLHALSSERQVARMLRTVIFAVVVMGAFTTWLAWRTPKTIEVHLLPNITADTAVQVKDGQSGVPPQNVYSFGYYIWQQINHWPKDGSVDYEAQIQAMQAYLTPRCQAQLAQDAQARGSAGELKNRTRTLTEIAGLSYAPNRVVDEGNGQAWTMFLDGQVQEAFRGTPVKDVYIRYPLRVVRYDVDRERNPWQLALDCYGSNQPARLSEDDLHPINPVTNKSELKAPVLPGAVEPAQLPVAVPLDQVPATPAAAAQPQAPEADTGTPQAPSQPQQPTQP
jgi:integrating conjugative element protein (TIGR03746 family)